MKDNKVLRVVGLASSLPLDTEDPLNPMNRRISLVVLNDKTERQIRGLPEEPVEEIQNEADAAQVLGLGDEAPPEGEVPVESPVLAPPGEIPAAPARAPEQRVALPAGRDPA
jgi:chemotaxis protein MotB